MHAVNVNLAHSTRIRLLTVYRERFFLKLRKHLYVHWSRLKSNRDGRQVHLGVMNVCIISPAKLRLTLPKLRLITITTNVYKFSHSVVAQRNYCINCMK